jgi:hypothetical protein
VNRWADINGDGIFDTQGSSGNGHRQFGCSISAMRDWTGLQNGTCSR